jgi:hypothetical protein
MKSYYVFNLENYTDFSVDNIVFKKTNDYEKKIQDLTKNQTDQPTFLAVISDNQLSNKSMFFEHSNVTSIDDIMKLLSLAQTRNIYYYTKEYTANTRNIFAKKTKNAYGYPVIMGHEIEIFLNTSLSKIRETNWLSKTGFNPAIFWWLESLLYSHVEMRFIALFIALELLANLFVSTMKLKNSGIRDRIKVLAESHKWDFMDIMLIKD